MLGFISNATVAKQAMDLATDRTDEKIIWLNSSVNVLMSEEMITEKQRKVAKEKKRHENRLKS